MFKWRDSICEQLENPQNMQRMCKLQISFCQEMLMSHTYSKTSVNVHALHTSDGQYDSQIPSANT